MKRIRTQRSEEYYFLVQDRPSVVSAQHFPGQDFLQAWPDHRRAGISVWQGCRLRTGWAVTELRTSVWNRLCDC